MKILGLSSSAGHFSVPKCLQRLSMGNSSSGVSFVQSTPRTAPRFPWDMITTNTLSVTLSFRCLENWITALSISCENTKRQTSVTVSLNKPHKKCLVFLNFPFHKSTFPVRFVCFTTSYPRPVSSLFMSSSSFLAPYLFKFSSVNVILVISRATRFLMEFWPQGKPEKQI